MHPRFDRQVFITRNDCIAGMAECLVRLSPYNYPDNLSGCLDEFSLVLAKALHWSDERGMKYIKKFSLRESTRFFESLINKCPSIVVLNNRKNGGEGNQFVDRYSGSGDPDNSFIDLTALAQNMTCHFADKADAEAFLEAV